MFYLLGEWLQGLYNLPGAGMFRYITFRAGAAAITALLISFFIGPIIIRKLQKLQIGEQAKVELSGVGNHSSKAGTPTMGGLIVLLALLLPTLLWADISNVYIVLIFISTVLLGSVGFLDDYLKVIKKFPRGLRGRYKIVGQVFVGCIVGGTIYFFPEFFSDGFSKVNTLTDVPFVKDYLFDFSIFYIPMVIYIITATSNAVNLTDGLDGLAIGTVGISVLALTIFAYISGNVNYSEYLNVIYLPGSGELAVFTAALVGAALGFSWFNSYPAQVFMGDTGSLALGGAVGVLCVLIKKEFLLPIVGGVFFMESISVILQVSYFKYTKKKYGEGRRIFKIAPLHHHYEKSGIHESKIVTRFYIAAVMLAILAMTSLKIR